MMRVMFLFVASLAAASAAMLNGTAVKVNSSPDDPKIVCYKAKATPLNIIPPITRWSDETRAPHGEFFIAINLTVGDATFLQTAKRIQQLTMTHLHQGDNQTNGPVIVPLTPYAFISNGNEPMFVPPLTIGDGTSRLEAMATISDDFFTGPLFRKDFSDFVALANQGRIYINYHTVDFPEGVIRGQLRRFTCSDNEMSDLRSMSM